MIVGAGGQKHQWHSYFNFMRVWKWREMCPLGPLLKVAVNTEGWRKSIKNDRAKNNNPVLCGLDSFRHLSLKQNISVSTQSSVNIKYTETSSTIVGVLVPNMEDTDYALWVKITQCYGNFYNRIKFWLYWDLPRNLQYSSDENILDVEPRIWLIINYSLFPAM